jgi:hypothetical protein
MTTAVPLFCPIPPSVWLDPHALHSHFWNNTPISRRTTAGYVHATAMGMLPGTPVDGEITFRCIRAQFAGA